MMLALYRRLRIRLDGEGMAVASSVMMRDALIGIGRHLVAITLGMRLSAARECGRSQRFARMHRRRRHQRTGEQSKQKEAPSAQHGASISD